MTPLLRWDGALLKLEMFGPRGSVAGRATYPARASLSGNQALAAARPGFEVALHGAVTHEMRETLKIWGVRVLSEGARYQAQPEQFVAIGRELLEQLAEAPMLVVAPAGELPALLGAISALIKKWPQIRGVALVAADEELPDLPRSAEVPPGIERVPVTRAQAADARRRVGRELGLLANHAGAAAAVYAHDHGGVALVTALGEREFSLDRAP